MKNFNVVYNKQAAPARMRSMSYYAAILFSQSANVHFPFSFYHKAQFEPLLSHPIRATMLDPHRIILAKHFGIQQYSEEVVGKKIIEKIDFLQTGGK